MSASPPPLRVLVVEDEPLFAFQLEAFLTDLTYHVIGPALDAASAQALLLQTHPRPDIALLDIHLGERGPDGIELAKVLVAEHPLPIIFLTSRADKQSFERARRVGPAAYLVKPIDAAAIQRAIELAVSNFVFRPPESELTSYADRLAQLADNQFGTAARTGVLLPQSLFVKENGILVKVQITDISWVMAEGRYCRLALGKGNIIQMRQPLHELNQYLPPEQFVQIQRSYIVNAECIERIDTVRSMVQVNGHLLPIGLTYRDNLLQRQRLV